MPRFAPLPDRRPAIVAGASSGIGEATAIELAAHGFPVALGARRVEKLEEIVGKIRADGGEAIALHLDVTDPDSVKSFVANAVDALGEIEVLVAGAGDTYFGKLAEISTDDFDSQLQIHLVGANRLATAVLPGMLERQRGDLIFVGSDVALRQRPHMGAYGAAKAALVAMVTNFQMELEGTGVRASIVHPGPTKTSMGWSLPAELIGPALEDWAKWGQARHDYFLRAADLARAITLRRGDTARRLHREHGTSARSTVGHHQGTSAAQSRRRGAQPAGGQERSDPGRDQMTTAIVPRVSGGEEEHGHLEEFRTDPIGLMNRIRDECGDVGWFQLVDKHVVFLSGAEANEFFFRSADEDLDQAEAYPFMTPIFGEGVVFDASPERRKEMLHNSALRGEQMKGHAATIENEVKKIIADWGDEGEIELLDFFSELTIYTSTACLIGLKFREQLDSRFAQYYHELERGTDPLCYVDPYLAIESFRHPRRGARETRCAGSGDHGRVGSPTRPRTRSDRDMLDVLVSIKDEEGNPRFSADEVTGMFISLMFAGHHTSSGTSSWTLIELIRHPDVYADVRHRTRGALRRRPGGELPCAAPDSVAGQRGQGDAAPAPAADHPDAGGPGRVRGRGLPDPQGRLRRRLPRDLATGSPRTSRTPTRSSRTATTSRSRPTSPTAGRGFRSAPAGTAVSAPRSPPCRSRRSSRFCLREYEFEMAQPADTYRNDHSKMVVQLDRPAKVRYRKRQA